MGEFVPVFDPGERRGPVVIIEHPTGIHYAGQVGGHACLRPEVEGFVIPLCHNQWRPLEGITHEYACGAMGLGAAAEALVSAWPDEQWGTWRLELDATRLDLGTEAWIPVVIRDQTQRAPEVVRQLDPNGEWLGGRRGWLLLPDNCD